MSASEEKLFETMAAMPNLVQAEDQGSYTFFGMVGMIYNNINADGRKDKEPIDCGEHDRIS